MRYIRSRLLTFVLGFAALFELSGCGAVRPMSVAKRKAVVFAEYDLPNGLHVILHEDHSLPIVSSYMLYHVGSKDERADRTGFAHFFEHLMFEGSENILRGEIDEFITEAGGTINATTSYDYTGYYTTLPANQLKLALWIESERMLQARIDSAGVEVQRRIVKEERRQRYDNQPYGSVYEDLVQSVFAGSAYAWTPIGSTQYIDQATLPEFSAFYKTYYVPNNAVLVLTGDFSAEKVKGWIAGYFSDIPRGTDVPRQPLAFAPQPEPRRKVIEKVTTSLPATVHAWRTAGLDNDDGYAVELLANALAKGNSSRLHKKLVEELQVAAEVEVVPMSLENAGLIGIFAVGRKPDAQGAGGASLPQLDSLISAEVEKLVKEELPEEEFFKVRNQKKAAFNSSFGTMLGRAETLSLNYMLMNKQTALINTELEKYLRVSRADLKRAAAKYFVKNGLNILHYPSAQGVQGNQGGQGK